MTDVETPSSGPEKAPATAREALDALQKQLQKYEAVQREIDATEAASETPDAELLERHTDAMKAIRTAKATFESLQNDTQLNDAERGLIAEALKVIEAGMSVDTVSGLRDTLKNLIEVSFEEESSEDEAEDAEEPTAREPASAPEESAPTVPKGEEYVFDQSKVADLQKKGGFANFIESMGSRGIGRMFNRVAATLRQFSIFKLFGQTEGTSLNAGLLDMLYENTGLMQADARQAVRDEIASSKMSLVLFEGVHDDREVKALHREYKGLHADNKPQVFADFVRERTLIFYNANRREITEFNKETNQVPKITLAAINGKPPRVLKLEKPSAA